MLRHIDRSSIFFLNWKLPQVNIGPGPVRIGAKWRRFENREEASEMEDWERCGNSFNNLRELIWWIIHHGGPPPPPPDDWLKSLAEVAFGLQNVVYAARTKDPAARTALARQGLEQAKHALNSIKV
jgi:hypothetical protein